MYGNSENLELKIKYHSKQLVSDYINTRMIHLWYVLSCFCSQLNFSEENYFENILENLAASAQKGHKKLREPVDPDMYETHKYMLKDIFLSWPVTESLLFLFVSMNVLGGLSVQLWSMHSTHTTETRLVSSY